MNPAHGRDGRPRPVRRAVVLLPNGFTLANLFCGIYAIVLASRANYDLAALFVTLGGLADALDGRVARATGSGSRFGEELDSLVDAISFGLAPAMIMFFAVLNTENWNWLLVFFFTACAVMRLARFNVEQAGRVKTHFHGLPSPAAGMTLASYWWFSNTPLFKQTVILFTDSTTLEHLPWHTEIIPGLMLLLGVLMLSDVPYVAWPKIGIRTWRQRIGTLVLLIVVVAVVRGPREFIFPGLVVYILAGLFQWVIVGLLQRRGSPEEIYWTDESDGADTTTELPARVATYPRVQPGPALIVPQTDEPKPGRRRRHRRRSSGGSSGGPSGFPGSPGNPQPPGGPASGPPGPRSSPPEPPKNSA